MAPSVWDAIVCENEVSDRISVRRHTQLIPVRWVSAIWSVLERSQAIRLAGSQRSLSHRSRPVSMLSAEGSATTQYIQEQGRPSLSPLASPLPVPISAAIRARTTDDAVITTSAGFSAPLVQRGSRRLAAGNLDRTRSLRRVASEADLSESTGPTDEYRFSEPNLADVPLTVDAARSRHTSRDFTFARGISPPLLASPPPEYSSPTRESFASAMSNVETTHWTPQSGPRPLGTSATTAIPISFTQSMQTAQPSTPIGTAYRYSTVTSAYTARATSPMNTARDFPSSSTMYTAPESTDRSTAQESSNSASMHTAPATHGSSRAAAPSEKTAVPAFAITKSSPAISVGPMMTRPEVTTHSSAIINALSGSQYSTARNVYNYSGPTGGSISPFETANGRASRLSTSSRGTGSTYDTAPPPVPPHDSQYSTASAGRSSPSSRNSALQRIQLHDAPVRSSYSTAPFPSEKSQYTTAPSVDDSYHTARPGTTRRSSDMTVYQTAPAKSSSSYTTAPPPPISRSITDASEHLSWHSDAQELAETATHVSEPDTDLGLLADLERQSSSGSNFSTQSAGVVIQSQYDTVAQWSPITAGPTVYGTIPEGTVFQTAMATIYTDAPSWHTQSTYMTTAQGTQE